MSAIYVIEEERLASGRRVWRTRMVTFDGEAPPASVSEVKLALLNAAENLPIRIDAVPHKGVDSKAKRKGD